MGMAYAKINLYAELKKLRRGKPIKVPLEVIATLALNNLPPEPRQKQKPRRKSKKDAEVAELERWYRLEGE